MLSFKNINQHTTYTIAHRGASVFEYENTLKAFQKAIDLQADAIEFDVRKTKDDVLLVHHNASLKKHTKAISKMSYSEIKEFNASSDYKIPTLEEVLNLCSGKISLDIELKETGYEQSVVELALKFYNIENLLFTSFKKKSLKAINDFDSNISTGFLFHKPIIINSIPLFVDYVLPYSSLCKLGYLKKLEKFGKPIIIWTVDKPTTKEKYMQKNIFAIVTNDPTS